MRSGKCIERSISAGCPIPGHSLGWRPVVMALAWLLLLPTISCAASPWRSESRQQPCREERQITGAQYWFREGYEGLQETRDEGSDRVGRYSSDSGFCFRVPLSEINNSDARVRGYKHAGKELLGVLARLQNDWNSTRALMQRKRFAALTGQEFTSFSELQKWWLENNDYLIWSGMQKHLVVDLDAKAERRAILPLHPAGVILAERYWFFEGMGWLRKVAEEGDILTARVWTGERESNVRISRPALLDHQSKREGYLQAVRLIIEDRFRLSELGPASERELIGRLQQITSESFGDRQSWIVWWNSNRSRLVLSRDGQKLTVGP